MNLNIHWDWVWTVSLICFFDAMIRLLVARVFAPRAKPQA